MPDTYCFSEGPPGYYWAKDTRMRNAISRIPETASLVPGENKPLQVCNRTNDYQSIQCKPCSVFFLLFEDVLPLRFLTVHKFNN